MQILIFLMVFTNIFVILFLALRYIARTINEKKLRQRYSEFFEVQEEAYDEELQLSL